jgi:hypothetical protein
VRTKLDTFTDLIKTIFKIIRILEVPKHLTEEMHTFHSYDFLKPEVINELNVLHFQQIQQGPQCVKAYVT